jgi:glycosyltransferase involved in cell wall biosynthesis
LRRGPFDVLVFLTHNPAVFHPGALRRTPTLLWTDVTPAQLDSLADTYGHPVDTSPVTRAVKHALVRRTFHGAALCLGWSEWVRRSLVTDYGVAEAQTGILPPGIDLSRWQVPPRPPPGAGEGLPRLLFVGGDFHRKGGDLLLDVFRSYLRGRCVLDIATRGDVPLQAGEEGVTVHKGLTAGSPALLSLYRAASAFVLPTRGDCSPIVLIEAMAMGLPVVSSAMAGIPEMIEDAASGYLVPVGDGAGLRAALESLLGDADRRRAMGMRGRALAQERFDAAKAAERLFAFAHSIAGRTGRKASRAVRGSRAVPASPNNDLGT